jgi:peroxiredoxin
MVFKARGRLLARALAVLFIAAIVAQFLHMVFARDLLNVDAPDFALKSTTGQNIRLSDYRGEVVAISFGASWCDDCANALRTLKSLRPATGLQLLSISFDRDPRPAGGDGSFPVLSDPEGVIGRLYDVNTLPLIVVVDREGKVQAVREGFHASDEPDLRRQVARLLAD